MLLINSQPFMQHFLHSKCTGRQVQHFKASSASRTHPVDDGRLLSRADTSRRYQRRAREGATTSPSARFLLPRHLSGAQRELLGCPCYTRSRVSQYWRYIAVLSLTHSGGGVPSSVVLLLFQCLILSFSRAVRP